jgi:hypothetical protein
MNVLREVGEDGIRPHGRTFLVTCCPFERVEFKIEGT